MLLLFFSKLLNLLCRMFLMENSDPQFFCNSTPFVSRLSKVWINYLFFFQNIKKMQLGKNEVIKSENGISISVG